MKLLVNKANVDAPDANYPFGNMRDNPGDGTGTPADTNFMSDYAQFFERLFDESGLTANELFDNLTNGFQLYEAFRQLTKPYLVYTALISQSGVNVPTVLVLGLNQIGNINWTRTGVGTYIGDLLGVFTFNQTFVQITSRSISDDFSMFWLDNDRIAVQTNADDVLSSTPIEIRVYN